MKAELLLLLLFFSRIFHRGKREENRFPKRRSLSFLFSSCAAAVCSVYSPTRFAPFFSFKAKGEKEKKERGEKAFVSQLSDAFCAKPKCFLSPLSPHGRGEWHASDTRLPLCSGKSGRRTPFLKAPVRESRERDVSLSNISFCTIQGRVSLKMTSFPIFCAKSTVISLLTRLYSEFFRKKRLFPPTNCW